MAKGGYEVDGREISPLDEQEIAGIARDIRAMGLRSIAISSVFAPLNNAQEERASEIIRAEYPDVRVTLSNEIGWVGLIERENAAVMNASLVELFHQGRRLVPGGVKRALDRGAPLHQPE